MQHIYSIISASLVLALTASCSSQQEKEAPPGYLATHIFEDGSKQFVYTVDLSGATPDRGKAGGNRPGNLKGQVQGTSSRGVSGGMSAGSGGGGKGGGMGSGKGGGKARAQQGYAALLNQAVDDELKRTGFCRDGFMELDREMPPEQTFIKGECLEAATERDREAFPNEE